MKAPFDFDSTIRGCVTFTQPLDPNPSSTFRMHRVSVRSLIAPVLVPLNAALQKCRAFPAGAVRILVLHDVPPHARPMLLRLLGHIAAGPGFVTPDQARDRLQGKLPADGKAPVLLSFDDGFVSNLAIARDLLEPQGIRALFFVCPGLIDLPAAHRRAAIAAHVFRGAVTENALPDDLDVIGWTDLEALARCGHEIGCHGLSHDRLSGLDMAALEKQVVTAKTRMAETLGQTTDWFAFPFGDLDSIDPAALSMIGAHFRWCRSGVRGLAHAGTPPLALPAESVDLTARWPWPRLAAEGGLAFRYRKPLATLTHWARSA